MIPLEYRSQENGKRMARSKDSLFTEMERNTRVSYLMKDDMARESTHMKTELSTRETGKMVIDTGLASRLTLVGTNMMAAGTRVRSME
jgi:hypothetical protein